MSWFLDFKRRRLDAKTRNQIFIPNTRDLDRLEAIVEGADYERFASCVICAQLVTDDHRDDCPYSDEWEG